MTDAKIKRPRGRPPAFEREAVLACAMETFWSLGFEGASIPALTNAMGISAQSLYAAFGSKDDLYRETVELYLRTNGAFFDLALTEEADAISGLKRMLRDAATVYTFRPAIGCMITTAPGGQGDDDLRKFGRKLRADGLRAVEARLERGLADGQIASDTDCETWARYVVNTLYGMSVQARDGASRRDLLAIADIAASHVDGLRPKNAKARLDRRSHANTGRRSSKR